MKWIRMSNSGDFDVVNAIQMIGASVKTTDNPIGLYGSGIKYAMAQAIRSRTTIKIADKGKVYTLTTKLRTFRGEDFFVVCLKTSTGKVYETGITSEFGKEDWNDPWFIFREFYSKMLDEGGSMDIVDGIKTIENGVSVFLPYGVFESQLEKLDKYFTGGDWRIRPGTGNVYKSGVWIGELDGCSFDFQSSDIQMTESRTMKRTSARSHVETYFQNCKNPEEWKLLLDSPEFYREINLTMSWYSSSDEITIALESALRDYVGDNYAVCPHVNTAIFNDAIQVYNRKPIVFPTMWSLPKSIVTIDNIAKEFSERGPTREEQVVISAAKSAIRDFFTTEFTIKVCDCNNGAGGYADIQNKVVMIGSSLIAKDIDEKTIKRTATVLLHEVNHIQTKADDYTRQFGRGYEEYLVKLMT